MKKKKVVTVFLLIILFSVSLLSADTLREHLVSAHRESVFPVDSLIGQTVDPSSSNELTLLARALSEEFSFEWTETYLEENTRVGILENMTNTLTSLLPQSQALFSQPFKNGDDSISVSVRFVDGGMVLSFVILGEKIIAIARK